MSAGSAYFGGYVKSLDPRRRNHAGSRERTAKLVAGVGALLVASACGSTVAPRTVASTSQFGLTQPGSGSGVGSTTGQGLSGQQPAGSLPGSMAGGGAAAVSGGPAATNSQTGLDGSTGGASTARVGAKQPLLVGVITSGNTGSYATTLGIHANFGDQRTQAQLIGKYINSHGGVLGHPIQFTFYDYNASASAATNAQAACAAFTQDHHAFAAMGVAGMDDSFHSCAYQHRMFILADADQKASSFFKKYSTTIEISDANLVRKRRAMVLALKSMGFFGSHAKVGLLYTDDAADVAGIDVGMKPALKSIGITPTDAVELSANDASAYYSEESNAVLKFRAEGVTNVLFGNASALVFDEAAQSQGYFPRMGIDSHQSPGLLLQGSAPNSELANTMGIGYQPVQDVTGAQDPGPVSANEKLCQKIFTENGQGWSSQLAEAAALYICDELFFLHDVFAGQSGLSQESFLNGVAGLGSRFQSTLTFNTRFSASQHDGAQAYRPLRFRTGNCDCFYYAGPEQSLG
jgi:ABC-type branched-subunit amino acid transport system substrate-binding protein